MRASFRFLSYGLIAILLWGTTIPAPAQSRVSGVRKKTNVKLSEREKIEREREREREKSRRLANTNAAIKKPLLNQKGEIIGEKVIGSDPIYKSTSEIMQQQSLREGEKTTRQLLWEKGIAPEMEGPDRSRLPQNPNAPAISQFPSPSQTELRKSKLTQSSDLMLPQPVALQFTAATLTDTGAFPPDTMGAVGPSQFVAFENGRIRSFTKAGVADGVLNVDPDVFFASVMTPVGGSVLLNFTSDPNVRYDRLTGRWFMTIIDVPCTNATCTTTAANRILFAVSDAASSSALTGGTVWTFFQFQGDPTTNFCDYPSLGIDANALYIGGNMFTSAGSFVGTNAYVIPKSPILGAGPIISWRFANIATGAAAGPFAPRGVDNPDPTNTGPTALGYFIGVDTLTFSTLMIRRVTDPSNTVVSPTISANISLTVPTTTSPNPVTHSGNTGGNNGRLDSLDDRLFAAVMRNGRLWTSHNFRVSAAGVANTAAASRNAIRWYEIQNLTATPSLVQSGTVYDTAATLAAARQYWIPSIAVSGQGHAAIGASTAGSAFFVDAFTIGRLSGDTLGTMQGSPGSLAGYTTSATAYNPPSDPGGAAGRRWGDYSFTSVDPLDDMTMWTVGEFCQATNSYAVRVAKLSAPPPASIANGPVAGKYNVQSGLASFLVTITGTSVSGSGFFDPGANLPAPALPFNHISASVSGANVTVNSVTYNSPTSITLNLNTLGAFTGQRDLTITNPDGQSVTRVGIINLLAPTAAGVEISGRVMSATGQGLSRVTVSLMNNAGQVRTVTTNSFGVYQFTDVPSGQTYVLSVSHPKYQFSQPSRTLNVVDSVSELDFTAEPN